ncbi:hypothetical protein SBA6_990022 [Candidatus Sulfopaludibacter sp. SbA6]|nr:hypothetical protein SBA6_990022 [Candidatus Sulfopaludibacter sp. SbA6]
MLAFLRQDLLDPNRILHRLPRPAMVRSEGARCAPALLTSIAGQELKTGWLL